MKKLLDRSTTTCPQGRNLRKNTNYSFLDQFVSILERKYDIDLERFEKRQPHVVPPRWIPPITHIAESTETAIKQHDATEPSTLCIYTDGSSINNHVGAAAVAPALQLDSICNMRKAYIGTLATSTVRLQ
ncbi:hypothetical protein B0O99DRAFT_531383 [Bisporella sp. PMI_857]|nr:hypothetical protein B0O99DRAFT_531383 [Bisporella sp. PMI_857]